MSKLQNQPIEGDKSFAGMKFRNKGLVPFRIS